MAQRQFRTDDTSFWAEKYSTGADGSWTPSSQTLTPIDSTASGTSGTTTLSATNASFTAGQIILIHQTYGSGAGGWELNKIASYVSGTITTSYTLTQNYSTGAQVIVMPRYSSVNIAGGVTITGKSWDGTTGGIITWICSGTTTISGTLAHNGVTGVGSSPNNNNVTVGGGFRGGGGWRTSSSTAIGGDGTGQLRGFFATPSGNEGGPGRSSGGDSGGGGGGNNGAGSNGASNSGTEGIGGSSVGNAALTNINMGGGGGGGRTDDAEGGHGGSGGGIIFIISKNITWPGIAYIYGGAGYGINQASGGGGAGGSLLIKAQNADLSSGTFNASGGGGGSAGASQAGGGGANGYLRVDYGNSITTTGASFSPSLSSAQDTVLNEYTVANSVKADIIRRNETQANSVKANIIRAGLDTKANSVKAFIPTYFKDNSVKAYIPTTQVSGSVKASIYSPYVQKKFEYRVYNQAGSQYITTWAGYEVLSEPTFRAVVNGGPGELIVKLARSFDDFGEDEDIKLYNTVKLYVFDRDAINGALLYSGYISGYRPVLDNHQEYLEVTILHRVTEFQNFMLRDASGNTSVAENSKDPGQMFKDIINYYRGDGGQINYTASSVDLTGSTASYTFQVYTVKEALDKAIELTPDDWYWRVDSDNLLHLHQSNMNTADHTFLIGKHITFMETWRRGEDIINRVYFVGQGDPPMYRVYSNTGSIDTYGIHAIKLVDQRVTNSATADILANRIIDRKKDPEIRTTVEIMDNNGMNLNRGYDIESIKVGQTMKIRNISQGVRTVSLWDIMQWDDNVWDQTLSFAAANVLQILSVEYRPNSIRIEASSRLPEISKRVEEVYRNLEQTQVYNAPSAPTPG